MLIQTLGNQKFIEKCWGDPGQIWVLPLISPKICCKNELMNLADFLHAGSDAILITPLILLCIIDFQMPGVCCTCYQ